MKVYKVVKKQDGVLTSICCDAEPKFKRVYEVNETTYPPEKYPDAWLYAFTNFGQAATFLEFLQNVECNLVVYEAETDEIKKAEFYALEDYRKFWTNKLKKGAKFKAPDGHILCSNITLTQEVYDGKVPF